ncbi:hypothetical protein [Haloarchaeobius sp. TZWWS8]|uniref:hypothetical protein n=1 Tax=Haloarchaeobius sp. TZWWS8 TaxID=3446121 RepID=UPI003EB69D68
MGLFETLRRLLGSTASETEPGARSRSTPAADPDRMYATAPETEESRGETGENETEPAVTGGSDSPGGDEAPPSEPPDVFSYEARECADFWHDYPLDFTVESLAHLDSLVADNWDADRFAGVEPDPAGGPDARTLYGIVQQFGSYVGETLVRDRGGEWKRSGRNRWVVVVSGPDGEATVDVFHHTVESFRESPSFRPLVQRIVEETGV